MTRDDYGVFERALMAFSILLFAAVAAAFTLQNCHPRAIDQTQIEGDVYIEIEAVTIEDHRVPMVERGRAVEVER